MKNRDRYFNNLPKIDSNSVLETNSLDALNSFLPKQQFCLRDERIQDYGVDATIEILENGLGTNFRAQIQLKGTRTIKPNKDGSYSLQVETNNLNYLLNNPISIYILYIEPKSEFRFIWARDEFKKLSTDNPNWIRQEKVSLRFDKILNEESLITIRNRIIKTSSLNRDLSEILILSTKSNLFVEINTSSLEITDKKEILSLISYYGINFVNEGFGNEISEKINLLDRQDRQTPSVQKVVAYLNYYFGHYKTAKDVISLLLVSEKGILDEDRQILDWVDINCDYRLGKINSSELADKLLDLSKNDDTEAFSAFRFNFLHQTLFSQSNSNKQDEKLIELKNEIEKLPKNKLYEENNLLYRYYISEAELGIAVKKLMEEMFKITVRKMSSLYDNQKKLKIDVRKLLKGFGDRLEKWENQINEIYKKTQNLTLKADILVQKVVSVIGSISVLRLHARANGEKIQNIDNEVFENCKSHLEKSISIYTSFNLIERRLRSESYLAEIINLKGEIEEAENIWSKVTQKSEKMSYAGIKHNSENPLSKTIERIVYEAENKDSDEEFANFSDEDVEAYSQDILETFDLPLDRYQNLKNDTISIRGICKEKFSWCEHIELHQDLTHTKRKETHYLKPPIYSCYCLKFNINSVVHNTDYKLVISAFKVNYCKNCSMRKPKKSAQPGRFD